MPDRLEMLSRAIRMAIASDDFETAAALIDSFQKEFQAAWAKPAGRETLLRNALDGALGSLQLTIERRDTLRHQLDLISTEPARRTPLSVSF